MSSDPAVTAVRNVLVPSLERDVRRSRRRGRQLRVGAVTAAAVLGTTAVAAAASGLIFAPPNVDHSVPVVATWTYAAGNPFTADPGPVLMRRHPGSQAAANRTTEAALAAQGVTARCGEDAGHPAACFLPSGDQVDGTAMFAALTRPDGTLVSPDRASDYDIRPLTSTEAHAWLCAHPAQRPGADGGEQPAPTAGYEDC